MISLAAELALSAGPFLITFREALEAVLIIIIIAAYLSKTGRLHARKYLFMGALSGVLASIIIGALTSIFFGGLKGPSEKLFEGAASLSAAGVLTYMIFWMARNSKNIKSDIHKKIDTAEKLEIGIFSLAFIVVVREGIETVLFLTSYSHQYPSETIIGIFAAAIAMSVLTFFMYKGLFRLNIQKFFRYTSVLLLVFAAGLVGYGVHEMMEYAEETGTRFGIIAESAYNINPADSQNPLHEKGYIGSILKALVGYDGNPEWLRVILYITYWVIIGMYLLKTYSKPGDVNAFRK